MKTTINPNNVNLAPVGSNQPRLNKAGKSRPNIVVARALRQSRRANH